MSGLSNSEILLSSALKDLLRYWDHAAAGWRDQARRQFEEEYIDQIEPAVKGSITAMTGIRGVLQQAIAQCD